jgi:hypothetical protein
MGHDDWSTLFAAIAAFSALVTVVTAWLSARYAAQTWRAQTEPKVIVYVKIDKNRPSILLLVIENIGRDIAHHVTFRPMRALPANAWGLPGSNIEPAEEMRSGPIVNGIPALGPGDTRVITWGQWAGLQQAIGGKPIDIEYSYNTRDRTVYERSRLEVDSFGITDASESPAASSVKQLENIAKSTREIAGAVKAIRDRLSSQARPRDADESPPAALQRLVVSKADEQGSDP